MANSVPKTLVAEASAGFRPRSTPQAIFQLMSLRYSTLAWTLARLTRTHSWSMTRRPSDALVCVAQRRTSASARWIGAVELAGDEGPAAVQGPYEGVGRHAHVVVEGLAGGRAGHRGHRRPREALDV